MSKLSRWSVFAVVLSFLALALSACETASPQRYEISLNQWVGEPVEDLISVWGVPDKQYDLNRKTRLISYERRDVRTYPGSSPICQTHIVRGRPFSNCSGGIPGHVERRYCETTFTVVKGTVTAWNYRGDGCRL